MRQKFISVYIAEIFIFSICGCAQTVEVAPSAEIENVEIGNVASKNEEEEDTADKESESGETDTESLDILREMEEYKSRFIELYSSNALSDEFSDVKLKMIIEEHDLSSDSSEGTSVTIYSDLSGKKLRYGLHYYGETGSTAINYYLCDNFVWASRQNNYYSSLTLSVEHLDVLYSTIENWIITDDATYIMHDNGELEEIDRTQLESEIPMPEEIKIKAMKMGYSQAGTIADIKDITWETVDYNVIDLHFHLEDGSAIDREIIGYSVLDIVYEDITGDDSDEVLIYCDFANNACDWQLVYFYQIDEGNVIDISPSSKDISELKSNEGYWNTWIAAKSMEGYSSPIYKLEDYYKEQGILYTAETLYIGYKDGKWKLVQEFEN